MTSTYSQSAVRQFGGLGAKAVEVQEIQSKKDALVTLENALKKRVCELKELCLKEGVSIDCWQVLSAVKYTTN